MPSWCDRVTLGRSPVSEWFPEWFGSRSRRGVRGVPRVNDVRPRAGVRLARRGDQGGGGCDMRRRLRLGRRIGRVGGATADDARASPPGAIDGGDDDDADCARGAPRGGDGGGEQPPRRRSWFPEWFPEGGGGGSKGGTTNGRAAATRALDRTRQNRRTRRTIRATAASPIHPRRGATSTPPRRRCVASSRPLRPSRPRPRPRRRRRFP